jgi:D-glycero-alpha-D-manno-heptose 1-phosphate guanylyltransferase
MEAIVLAGGFGTRLQKVVKDVPKPMALINGRPFLEYQLNYLKSYGIHHIIFSVGYLHHSISSHFNDTYNGLSIDYAIEEEALGTGGGISNALKKSSDDEVIVLNGDTLFEVDLKNMINFHKNKKSEFTMALRYLTDVSRYGTVEIDEHDKVVDFNEKYARKGEGYINGGIYILSKCFFNDLGLPQKFSLEKDVLEKVTSQKRIFGFKCRDYFLDIGIPEDYQKAQNEFKRFKY